MRRHVGLDIGDGFDFSALAVYGHGVIIEALGRVTDSFAIAARAIEAFWQNARPFFDLLRPIMLTQLVADIRATQTDPDKANPEVGILADLLEDHPELELVLRRLLGKMIGKDVEIVVKIPQQFGRGAETTFSDAVILEIGSRRIVAEAKNLAMKTLLGTYELGGPDEQLGTAPR